MKTIGCIGLGHMGHPMVLNLIKAGFQVKVFDLDEQAMQALVKKGGLAQSSVLQTTQNSDAVITMLQTGQQVSDCCLGSEGIFENLKKGAIFIDCSTIDIEHSKSLHQHAMQSKVTMVDAPVSGGVAAAEAGTLTFMVGGEDHAFKQAEHFIKPMAKSVIHAGRAGSGVVAKICNNMILGVSMIAVSEAFVLAEELGLEAKKLHEICSNASAQCWALTSYCPWPDIMPNVPSSHDYKAGFATKMMLKDLYLSQVAANHAESPTPMGEAATRLYQQYANEHAEVDFSGIINMLREATN